jgi:hypothetical protein
MIVYMTMGQSVFIITEGIEANCGSGGRTMIVIILNCTNLAMSAGGDSLLLRLARFALVG